MNKFEECLIEWERFELFVASILYDTWRLYTKNPDKYWIDLLWKAGNVEVKLDTKWEETWNHFFEVSYWLAPSWVFKYDSMQYFVIWTYDEFFLLEKNDLMRMLLIYWEQRYWWDDMKSFWYIVAKKEVRECARFIYKKT
jgi:hypothetical protein